jgi:hypothetical protein
MRQTLKGKLKPDIHNYDQRIESVLKRIERDLSKQNVALIKKYHNAMILETAKATQLKHLEVMLNLSRFLKKDWKSTAKGNTESKIEHRKIWVCCSEYAAIGLCSKNRRLCKSD